MANLIQNNSKLIEQVTRTSQTISQTQNMQNSKREQSDERQPKTIKIIKDQSGFGFNVRGQISGNWQVFLSSGEKKSILPICDVSPSLSFMFNAHNFPKLKSKFILNPKKIEKIPENLARHEKFWLIFYFLCIFVREKSWWTVEIYQRWTLRSATTCISDTRKRLCRAGWNQKRRSNPRSVSL